MTPISNVSNTGIRDLVQKAIADGDYTISAVAKAISYSDSTLSTYLGGKYAANPGKIEAALIAWLRKCGIAVNDEPADIFVDTKASNTVVNACVTAQEEGCIVAVIGPPGAGKSMGIAAWQRLARRDGIRHVTVVADVTTSAVALIRKIAAALGLRSAASASQLLDAVKEKLQRDTSVLIIDEAQHLGVKALEAARAIHDETRTGLVLIGSLALDRTLTEGDGTASELAQLRDRISELHYVAVLTPLEVTRFAAKWLGRPVDDGDAARALQEVSAGVPRRLVRLLNHCRRIEGGREGRQDFTGLLVREAAKRLFGGLKAAA